MPFTHTGLALRTTQREAGWNNLMQKLEEPHQKWWDQVSSNYWLVKDDMRLLSSATSSLGIITGCAKLAMVLALSLRHTTCNS